MDKAQFINSLSDWFVNSEANNDGISKLAYVKTDGYEFLYVIYSGYSQKRVNISFDSARAILTDFGRFLDCPSNWKWLDDEDFIEVEE